MKRIVRFRYTEKRKLYDIHIYRFLPRYIMHRFYRVGSESPSGERVKELLYTLEDAKSYGGYIEFSIPKQEKEDENQTREIDRPDPVRRNNRQGRKGC